MTGEEIYLALGEDYNGILERLRRPALIEKLLMMFLKDGSMEELRRALPAGDAETAFRAVHTLKGVALNLGLNRLAASASELTELLRARQIPPEASDAFGVLDALYTKTCDVIKLLG